MAKCDKCEKEVHPNDLELVEEIGRPFWVCTECHTNKEEVAVKS